MRRLHIARPAPVITAPKAARTAPFVHGVGAGKGNRTLTVSPPADFESAASTSSAIPARGRIIHETVGAQQGKVAAIANDVQLAGPPRRKFARRVMRPESGAVNIELSVVSGLPI